VLTLISLKLDNDFLGRPADRVHFFNYNNLCTGWPKCDPYRDINLFLTHVVFLPCFVLKFHCDSLTAGGDDF